MNKDKVREAWLRELEVVEDRFTADTCIDPDCCPDSAAAFERAVLNYDSDLSLNTEYSSIRELSYHVRTYRELLDTKYIQTSNWKPWLFDIMVPEIEQEWKVFRYGEFMTEIESIDDIVEMHCLNFGVHETPGSMTEMIYALRRHLNEWTRAYGCGQLRTRVRRHIHNNDEYYNDFVSLLIAANPDFMDGSSGSMDLFQKIYDSREAVKAHYSKHGYGYLPLVFSPGVEKESQHEGYTHMDYLKCPYCECDNISVAFDEEAFILSLPTDPFYSDTNNQSYGYRKLQIYFQCDNSCCGLSHTGSEDESRPPYVRSWFTTWGYVWVDSPKEMSFEELLHDPYYLQWVH